MHYLRLLPALLLMAKMASAPLAAEGKSDFDYLLGDWEFTAESKEFGKFGGRWSAVRLVTGQILDEYRVVGDNGQTFYATTTVRAYNAPAKQWELIGMDGEGRVAGLRNGAHGR